MAKPSVLSVGIGIGVLMLGGSGIAIPTLWSRANRAESHRDELQDSWQDHRNAQVASDDALKATQQQLAELQTKTEASEEALRLANEGKRELTSQLAKMQAQNRELMATSGTLELRDKETATLVQQLEQLRADNASLLALRDAIAATDDASQPDSDSVATDDTSQPDNDSLDTDDLVPVPPGLPRTREPTPSRDDATATSQVTAKPATTQAIRFDDSGWKSVVPSATANTVYRSPLID